MKKISSTLILTFAMCFFSTFALADVYGYINEGGVIMLSDTPANEAYQLLAVSPVEQVNIPATKRSPPLEHRTQNVATKGMHFNEEVNVAAKNSGVESALLHAVITAESNYNPKAVSVKGATGLMQLMPQTARRFGVRNIYDPKQNIQGGAHYLAYLLGLFNNNYRLAIAAYNAGENAVIRYGNKVPPYRETLGYVDKVMMVYNDIR